MIFRRRRRKRCVSFSTIKWHLMWNKLNGKVRRSSRKVAGALAKRTVHQNRVSVHLQYVRLAGTNRIASHRISLVCQRLLYSQLNDGLLCLPKIFLHKIHFTTCWLYVDIHTGYWVRFQVMGTKSSPFTCHISCVWEIRWHYCRCIVWHVLFLSLTCECVPTAY